MKEADKVAAQRTTGEDVSVTARKKVEERNVEKIAEVGGEGEKTTEREDQEARADIVGGDRTGI